MLRRKPQVTDKIRQRISIALGLLKLFPDQLYTSNDLYPASNTNVYYRVKEAQATALALTKVGSNSQTAVDYSARVVDPNRFLGDLLAPFLPYLMQLAIGQAGFAALPEDTKFLSRLMNYLVAIVRVRHKGVVLKHSKHGQVDRFLYDSVEEWYVSRGGNLNDSRTAALVWQARQSRRVDRIVETAVSSSTPSPGRHVSADRSPQHERNALYSMSKSSNDPISRRVLLPGRAGLGRSSSALSSVELTRRQQAVYGMTHTA